MPTVMQWIQALETKIEEQKRYAFCSCSSVGAGLLAMAA